MAAYPRIFNVGTEQRREVNVQATLWSSRCERPVSVRVAPLYIARLSHIGRRLAIGVERWWGCIVIRATRLVMASTGAHMML
jgi:hypothetical protein